MPLHSASPLINSPHAPMPNKAFKDFERETAELIGGKRYPANSGYKVDCEGPNIVAQCKLTKNLSLEGLTQLAEMIAAQGEAVEKLGIVAVKVRRGAGRPSPGLVVMTFETWARLTQPPMIMRPL